MVARNFEFFFNLKLFLSDLKYSNLNHLQNDQNFFEISKNFSSSVIGSSPKNGAK